MIWLALYGLFLAVWLAAVWHVADTAFRAYVDDYGAHLQAQLERRAEFDRLCLVPDLTVTIIPDTLAFEQATGAVSSAMLDFARAFASGPDRRLIAPPIEHDRFTRELLDELAKPMVVMADPDCRCACHRVDGCFFVLHTRDCCPTPGAKLRPEDVR